MKGQPRVLLLSVTDDSVLKQMQAARDITRPNTAMEIVEDALTLVN
jgi:hypothetical protein